MIERLSFKNANTLGEIETRVLDKIDEIAEVVNALTESKKEVMLLKKRISVLETNNNVNKVACGEERIVNAEMFNIPTPWEPFREEVITTITQSKDGVMVTIGKKETGSSMKMTVGQLDCKVTSSDIKLMADKWDRTKADISSLKGNR